MKKLLVSLIFPKKVYIITELLKIYTKAVEEITAKEDKRSIQRALFRHCVHYGVCCCCLNNLKVPIEKKRWVKRHVLLKGYWRGYWSVKPIAINETYPYYKQSILGALDTRILILKEELERF